MPARLIDGLLTTPATSAAFSDEALVGAMLEFEAALARAEASCGVVPAAAATVISEVARTVSFDSGALAAGLRTHATLSIPVVQALTQAVAARHGDAARYVHWGATSQDVYDTALVLCLRRAWGSIEADHLRVLSALEALAVQHADSLMLGRTLLQPALPTTFGLKAARWLGGIERSWRSLSTAFDATQVLQFGGAAGTLASLGEHGVAVEAALAGELDLLVPDAPWHAERDRVVSFVAAGGAYVAALAKLARDVSLLMQHEVGEVAEAGGGSSTMPHKRNPARSAAVLACAHRMPGLVSTVLQGAVQEQERAVGGWQAEGAALAAAVETTGAAVCATAELLEGLTVDTTRMRRNVEAIGGVMLAERVTLAASVSLDRDRATELVKQAVQAAAASGRPLAATVADSRELMAALEGVDLAQLFEPASYLGSADVFRARLLTAALPGVRKH